MNQKENKRYERLSSSSKKQLVIESDQVLHELQTEFTDNLSGMDYFYGVAHQFARGQLSNQEKRKYIATSCVQVPIELIYAAGALPVRTCSGAHSMSMAGAEFLPARSCSLVNATFGVIHT
ncbi:MAG: 2-hydroxyacyl-CoA dehydratase, partial [Bacteroidetes bacterium]